MTAMAGAAVDAAVRGAGLVAVPVPGAASGVPVPGVRVVRAGPVGVPASAVEAVLVVVVDLAVVVAVDRVPAAAPDPRAKARV